MAMDFPNSPSVGQVFTVDSNQWMWDGTSWNARTPNTSFIPHSGTHQAGGVDEIIIPPVILKLNCIDNADINDTETWTSRAIFDVSAAPINLGGFTFNSSIITIPEDGIYQCIFNFFIIAPDTTEARMNPGARWSINTSLQNEIAASAYIRSEQGHDESSLHLSSVFQLSSGDALSVYWSQLGGIDVDVYVSGQNSNVQIIKIS